MAGRLPLAPKAALAAELKLRRKEKLLRALQRLNDSATQQAASEELIISINVMVQHSCVCVRVPCTTETGAVCVTFVPVSLQCRDLMLMG